MENLNSLENEYRQCLEALARENQREEVLKRRIIRLLVLTLLSFFAWGIYFLHSYQIKITIRQ